MGDFWTQEVTRQRAKEYAKKYPRYDPPKVFLITILALPPTCVLLYLAWHVIIYGEIVLFSKW